MSRVQRVAQAVVRIGDATLDALVEAFPDLTRHQIQVSVNQACAAGLIRPLRKGSGGHNSTPGAWGPLSNEPPAVLSSVFRLADAPVWKGPWPPAAGHPQVYRHLGD